MRPSGIAWTRWGITVGGRNNLTLEYRVGAQCLHNGPRLMVVDAQTLNTHSPEHRCVCTHASPFLTVSLSRRAVPTLQRQILRYTSLATSKPAEGSNADAPEATPNPKVACYQPYRGDVENSHGRLSKFTEIEAQPDLVLVQGA
jgi:hypothetical protein